MANKDTLSKYKAFKKSLDTYVYVQPQPVVKRKALTQQEMLQKAIELINK